MSVKKRTPHKPKKRGAPPGTWTVYIVRCSDGSFYTGYTGHVEQRLAAHNNGKGAKYTASRRPVELVYRETFTDRFEAMKREYRIKCLTRAKKQALIDHAGACSSGHRVEAARPEWMASRDAFQRKPSTTQSAMLLQRFDGIVGTGWIIAARRGQKWRERHLVSPNE